MKIYQRIKGNEEKIQKEQNTIKLEHICHMHPTYYNVCCLMTLQGFSEDSVVGMKLKFYMLQGACDNQTALCLFSNQIFHDTAVKVGYHFKREKICGGIIKTTSQLQGSTLWLRRVLYASICKHVEIMFRRIITPIHLTKL